MPTFTTDPEIKGAIFALQPDELQFQRATMKRRPIKRIERISNCICCDYPISQRHHLLPVSIYGENDACIQLCAKCHEIYHIFYDAHVIYETLPDFANISKKIFRSAMKSLRVYLKIVETFQLHHKAHESDFLANIVNQTYKLRKEGGEYYDIHN